MTLKEIPNEPVASLDAGNVALRKIECTTSDQSASLMEKAKRTAINLFLTFHLVAIACWCVPIDSPLIPLFRDLVRPYFLWAGLFQSWDMFAPIPKEANTYLEATIL